MGTGLFLTVWFQRYRRFFSLINNTGANEVQPTPSWDDFIQNALISCFINLEPQAAMFKAAGEPRARSAGKEGKFDTEELRTTCTRACVPTLCLEL